MQYYVYIIQSEKSNQTYIGHTNNLSDRINRHNQNRNKFTKGKGPWEVIAFHNCETKSEAYKLEMKLKAFKNSKLAIEYLNNMA